jgi:hypothetical protein
MMLVVQLRQILKSWRTSNKLKDELEGTAPGVQYNKSVQKNRFWRVDMRHSSLSGIFRSSSEHMYYSVCLFVPVSQLSVDVALQIVVGTNSNPPSTLSTTVM